MKEIEEQLFVEDIPVIDLARQYSTPLFIYSSETITNNFQRYQKEIRDGDLICYAVKANSNLHILSLLSKLGSGFDVVSGNELKRCIKAGVDKSKIVFSGVAKSYEEIKFAIENHQDFTSAELVEFCEMTSGVGITYDTGNSFPVAESPNQFTKTVAPHVIHLQLKDYRVQFTNEGFRLVRCTIGEGAVPFDELFKEIGKHQNQLTAVLEPGVLEARHVKLFKEDWWRLSSKIGN